MKWSAGLLATVGGLCLSGLQAQDLTALARAQVRAAAPAGAQVSLDPAPVAWHQMPPRPCRSGLQAQVVSTRISPRMEVRFQCPGPMGWVSHVMVSWHVFAPVLVTTRPLARLDAINADTARLERRDLTQLGYGYISDAGVLGQRFVARPLGAGVVLTPAMLMHHELVRSGDDVVLQSQFDGIMVRAAGLALSGGDQGDRVRVRNSSSGKVLEAVVVARGVVDVMP